MQKDVNDQELTLKKRARRRLVGAIALVLLMVIVLPMILKDRSIKQPADEVTITLDSQRKPEILPEVSDFDSNVVPSNEVDAQQDELKSNDVASQSETPEADADVDPEAAPKLKAEGLSADSKKTPVKQVEAPKADNKKSTVSAKFYVQIGVFSDEANVKKLQAKLTELGYKSQTEKIDTAKGKKIRLRTQLLGERNDAAIALQNIKDAGLTGMVVSQ
ncbi:SPOR domain-containing protein [Methylotenera versatilis]|uniref:SPOR domain-containing protein n=1 Tax=Methylotenera versatilis TaxID=1055487 RepID=UPI0006459A66|nr:SPOR domain-containing protein [Methylotenera versatilis]